MIGARCMVCAVVLAAFPLAEARAAKIVLPRPGQVGIGVQGQYGMLAETGDLGDLFSTGAGLAVRLRYRMRYERALGLSFEAQEFEARVAGVRGDTTAKRLKLITSGIEIYQLFDTRDPTTKMLSAGIGIVQPSAKLNSDETSFPEDGFYVSAGAGIERFFWRSVAYDVSTRYMAIFQRGKTNHDVQISGGLVFYASY